MFRRSMEFYSVPKIYTTLAHFEWTLEKMYFFKKGSIACSNDGILNRGTQEPSFHSVCLLVIESVQQSNVCNNVRK